MYDQNGFDNSGNYHYSYSSQPGDPWQAPQQTPPTPDRKSVV